MRQQWVSQSILTRDLTHCHLYFDIFLIFFLFFISGYNFDQITCESCKAFFRRNALNNAVSFGSTSISQRINVI